ncbi:Tyrosine phosphatase family, putative [Angomonas deanei]|uniref:phosphatidylinositol-3,4,5-trisphosphate 3-phosphatase n=1 Tax=Angomonas deanei TaxID=59799 RepID=A0A7G2CX10_9TRYP|nr:Tyrosine phosphatase family, putative [Angomonas deanei]
MSKKARYLVSQKKLRTVDKTVPQGSVDLDLVEINPRVVSMGFPASGFEALYRNKYEDALRYLDYKYGEHYTVYNLCKEKAYQYKKEKFHGRVKSFPFYDHHAAPLKLIEDFVCDTIQYLKDDKANVVVIHCKAGKGRTGIMTCVLLLLLEPQLDMSAEAAIRVYGERRTSDGNGLTVPSQQRSVYYYEKILRMFNGVVPKEIPVIHLRAVVLRGMGGKVSVHSVKIFVGEVEEFVEIRPKKQCKEDPANSSAAPGAAGPNSGEDINSISCDEEEQLHRLSGDLRFELWSGKDLVGALSVHTLFLKERYGCTEIDKIAKLNDPLISIELLYDVVNT